MYKSLVLTCITIFVSAAAVFSQPTPKPTVADNEELFTAAQVASLDSAIKAFTANTAFPISVITFGGGQIDKEHTDDYVSQTDSALHAGRLTEDMAIFLSKEFRALNFKANSARDLDPTKVDAWKNDMKTLFLNAAQPYIPLLKQGKYFEAIYATINELSTVLKK